MPPNPPARLRPFPRASTPSRRITITDPLVATPSPLRAAANPLIMSAAPFFWSTPLKYCRWAAREKPALFWSVVIGAAGPLAMPIGPPIRRWLGDVDPAPIPVTYPVPTGPRKQLTGYDDE